MTWWTSFLAMAFWSNYHKHDTQGTSLLAIRKAEEKKAISLFKRIQAPSTGRHFIQQ
jgi:hypothetical protein